MSKILFMPIRWFGNRDAFEKSELKIISVGLNPSDKEFREKDSDKFSSQLRFPDYTEGNDNSLVTSYNNYFDHKPYCKWFDAGFEPILNGMNASYYSNQYCYRAIHTDICSPWATVPTWTKLPKQDKSSLFNEGFPEWQNLVKKLDPDIILFSIPKEYYAKILGGCLTEFCKYTETRNGQNRKKPVIIKKGKYERALAFLGQTWNLPFGSLGKEQKIDLGKNILNYFNHS